MSVTTSAPTIARPPLFALAAGAGVAVANIYYNQPMLGLIETTFPGAAMIPTVTQLGYAAGLFFLLPLSDRMERKRLILIQLGLLMVWLVLSATASSAAILLIAAFGLGASATAAQQIVPFATILSEPHKHGAAIGTVMAGLLSGILLSRTVSGLVSEAWGWRAMFTLAVVPVLVIALILARRLPRHEPAQRVPYTQLLASVAQLWRQHPPLRQAAFAQALLFASFSAFWTILALYLATPHFHLGAGVAGLFGIVGLAGIAAAPLAGKLADRFGPHSAIYGGTGVSLAAWLVMLWQPNLAGLIVGVILLDFGVQSALISHQHVVFRLDPAARGRLNALFMTAVFLGGATGSALSALEWPSGGWTGVSVIGALLALAAALPYGFKAIGQKG